MKVIHIESGLGNQMLSYCEYLALKYANPNDTIYIETITYDIPECNDIICQWNGFELPRIFNINAPNIQSTFSQDVWDQLIEDIRKSKFWIHNWNWPVRMQKAFEKNGLTLKNIRGDFEEKGHSIVALNPDQKKTFKAWMREQDWYIFLRAQKKRLQDKRRSYTYSNEHIHFFSTPDDIFTGQRLSFKFKGSGIEKIADEVRKVFTFPSHENIRNIECERRIHECNSVAIHARRGDMLGYNYDCYRFGYFKRCVRYIRSQVCNPVFFIFCDPDSVSWAKENSNVFGLDFQKDEIHFVDWNKGEESYRDMQLMAECKHQVITRSSFGWWGAWLNQNPHKITCSPDILIDTTHHF